MNSNNNTSDNGNNVNVMSEVTALIRSWEDEHTQHNYNPINTLTRLAEIIEVETMNYLKMDPDPFDERHPSRTDPDCKLGQILKALFRKDNFMNKLVNDYLNDKYYSRAGITGMDVDQLNIAGCRLMLDIMPGLEISVVFQPDMDSLIYRLIKWSDNSIEPLQSYATGILAAAMEIPEIAARFRESNAVLLPLLLQRLHRLLNSSSFPKSTQLSRPFAHLSSIKSPPLKSGDGIIKPPPPLTSNKRPRDSILSPIRPLIEREDNETRQEGDSCQKRKKQRVEYEATNGTIQASSTDSSPQKSVVFTETSNSSWAELESFMIGTVQMFPPTTATRQILILRYLTPLGEYQEFLSHVFKHNALQLILSYVNVRETKEARLAFEALKYLASLLCHKKFAIEFINRKGLEALLEVPRPSIAATGVSICLYYLGYCEEAMERVCLLPKYILQNLVKYALWLLECSHDSGRCHAIMFFGLTFQFKIILEEFDSQDGLRLLHNVIATLPILLPDPDSEQLLNEDQESAARQIVRHVCVALRRYLEAHLHLKVELMQRSQMKPSERTSTSSGISSQPGYIACKSSPEEIQQQINTLLQSMPIRGHWSPVDQLFKHGCITLLLKIIAFAYEWNYSGRAETVRSALDVLAIACIMPKVQLLFCDKIDLPDESGTHGFNIILGAAEGEIVADADVQKAALRVIVNCVCGPINRSGGVSNNRLASVSSPNKKFRFKTIEELREKIWDCVQSCSGILILLSLMKVKTPITDADCIRTLACKALGGLARSETVRQIVSKLPLFTSGQLQNLMREPILQEKRQEHVNFQKYALELLEKLSGKTKRTGNDLEVSLSNIHRANVVAQTKIQFNDRQLLQLIHQHLVSKGFVDTASLLVKEARLSQAITSINPQQPLKFRYSSTLTPTRQRLSFCSPISRTLSSPSLTQEPAPSSSNANVVPSTTIKIVKKNVNQPQLSPSQNSRLQKQTTSDPHLRIKETPLEDISQVTEQPRVSLDSIVTEYLTNQHALCKNPMATCPQFNLFVPHKCPDPKPKLNYAYNVAIRSTRRQIGFQSKTLDRKFIHSRFCPVQTIRSTTDDGFFTCAKFMPGDQSIIVGDYIGEVRIFNLHTGNEESSFQAHSNYIVHIEPNRTGEFVLTSATWGRPVSALWSLRDHQMKTPFNEEEYIEYSKVNQDKILGTKGEIASIYDSNIGLEISKLVPTNSNHYTKNKATFSPNDDLILTDGVLFDVASGKQIHKLDKLNQMQSGVFHPNGLEIVSNTEVWDLRTFKLLKTVSVLSQCSTVFSPINNAIYAISIEQELDDGDSTFDSSFKIVDAIDYSSTYTYDVKKNIYDLAVNRYDTQIAIVENQGMYQAVQESSVRIYDVGKKREDDDEQEEEDDDDDMDGSDDDDDDVLIDLRDETDNHDNNENNDDDNQEDDDDDNSSDGSDNWSTDSFSDSDDLLDDDSILNDLLFEL